MPVMKARPFDRLGRSTKADLINFTSARPNSKLPTTIRADRSAR
jgi:hypothetical protein